MGVNLLGGTARIWSKRPSDDPGLMPDTGAIPTNGDFRITLQAA